MTSHDLQGVILAAGKGTRLHPITMTRSKAMLPILGRPIVERVIEGLSCNGVRRFVLVVSPEDREIVAYFTQRSVFRERVTLVPQARRLGMAHALQQAAPHIHGPFVLSACDNLVPDEHIGRLIAFHRADPTNTATLSLMRVPREAVRHTGIVALEQGHITRIVEKPQPAEAPSDIASLPLYVFEPQILDFLPRVPRSARGEYELQDAIQLLIEEVGGVRGVLTTSRLTLTTAADLLAINRHYLRRPQLAVVEGGMEAGTRILPPVRIEAGTTVEPGCVIGPDVYLERGARVGRRAVLRRAIVLRGGAVPEGSTVEDQVIAGV